MRTSGANALDARADFQRARRRHLLARVRRWLSVSCRRPNRPRDLGDVPALVWRSAHLRSIPLDEIVGTVDPTADFDADFRPATERLSARWQSIARAHRDGRSLPPIVVIERPDGYYILDGRHRVSVARALGHDHIDTCVRPMPRAGRHHALSADGKPLPPPCLPDHAKEPLHDDQDESPHSRRHRLPYAGGFTRRA